MTELKQRSMIWRHLRVGDVTASRFRDVMTHPRTKRAKEAGEMSQTAESYLQEKLAELLTGEPADRLVGLAAPAWGADWEEVAREKATPIIRDRLGKDVQLPEGEYAYMTHATEAGIGCSPDGIIGDDGLLELKCPYNSRYHVATILNQRRGIPAEHLPQVQGSLWVTGRTWYFFVSFDPRMPEEWQMVTIPVERDEEYIERLAAKVVAFRDRLYQTYQEITGRAVAPF